MKRLLQLTLLALMALPAVAQENPAPLPPNYELIKKVTGRWFGEYRYKSLVKRFERCDTTMTVDHFRCLYYGAALRGDSTQTLMRYGQDFRRLTDSLGMWHPTTQQAWWRLQMLLAAVWSSGNGEREHPFYVSCADDARYMIYECRDMPYDIFNNIYPFEYSPTPKMLLESAGLLPDERQAELFKEIATTWSFGNDSLLNLLLATYDRPEAKLWAELQVIQHNNWRGRMLRRVVDRHRDDTMALAAELFFLLAEDYYREAIGYDEDTCFAHAIEVCNMVIHRWPGSDAAERCRVLADRCRQPEVMMHRHHQQHIEPLPASEWALTTLWYRNSKRVWLQLYELTDTTFQHPLREWNMRVAHHDDLLWHQTYVYLPPMEEGRYLLRASADRKFRSWGEIEIVRSDLTLLMEDKGSGYVLNLLNGDPVEGFSVEALSYKDSLLATAVTDSLGRFEFENLNERKDKWCPHLRAMYKGIDLGDGTTFFSRPPLDSGEEFCDVTVNGEETLWGLHAGDTINFRCLFFTLGGVEAGVRRTVGLGDHHGYDIIDSVEVVTDEHGVAHGRFVLPEDSANYTVWGGNGSDAAYVSTQEKDEWSPDMEVIPGWEPDSSWRKPFWDFDYQYHAWDSLDFTCWTDSRWKSDSVEVGLTFERLHVPQEHLLNPSAMTPEAEHTMSEREFRRHYPLQAYDWRGNNCDTWEADPPAFSLRQRFPLQRWNPLEAHFDLPPVEEGVYRSTVTIYSPHGRALNTQRTTLYTDRLPFVGGPVVARTPFEILQVGDTLWLHLSTWLPGQQIVLSVRFNNHKTVSRHIRLSEEVKNIPIPVTEEGFVTIYLATACHGVSQAGTGYRFVGEMGKVLWENESNHFYIVSDLETPHWRKYRIKLHRPPLEYPLRKRVLPEVWPYLGLESRRNFGGTYCPGEYRRERCFSDFLHLPR